MAARYWVGGSGTWDGSSTTHWSATDGGASGASAPTTADVANFTANSGLSTGNPAVTIASTATCGGCIIGGLNNNNIQFTLSGNVTFGAGTYTFVGNSQGTRPIFSSGTPGTVRTWTFNGTHTGHTDIDFMDLTIAGTGGNIGGTRIGDAGGNTGLNASPSVTQSWLGTTGGNYGDPTKWSGRVPLPQDDVVISNAFAATQTITVDVRRLGRSVDFTGTTGSPTITMTNQVFIYGSLTLIVGITYNVGGTDHQFRGRGAYTIQPAGKVFRTSVFAFGGSYTLQGDLSAGTNTCAITMGDFTTANFNVTCFNFSVGGNGSTVTPGSSTFTLNGNSTVWSFPATAATYAGTGAETIVLIDTSVAVKTFTAGGRSYGTLRYNVAGNGGLIIASATAPSFVNLDVEAI